MKAAFVVQRYGVEVNGGAEYLCRLLAEHLSKHFEVTVLTTCALDYVEWRNHYPEGASRENGVPVHRFKVDKQRNVEEFDRFSDKVLRHAHTDADELKWMELQGPYCPSLLDHIRENSGAFDLFVFYTYLYFTTFHGLPIVASKSVLVPTAHDEPPIRLRMFGNVFGSPKFIVYNTPAERDFVHRTFHNKHVPHSVVGTGVDVQLESDVEGFGKRFGITGDYILYAGRVDESKGCRKLFDFFQRYKATYPGDLKLVVIGEPVMVIPKHPDIVSLGFVPEEVKLAAMGAAQVVVLPSQYESLSIVSLESWMLEKPVLVNGNSPVLRDNCIHSNGGLYYASYPEFEACLNYLLRNPGVRGRMGSNGRAYVEANYSWPVVEEKYLKIVGQLLGQERIRTHLRQEVKQP